MAKGTGILLTQEVDLMIVVERDVDDVIVSGIRTGDSLYQNQYLILQSQKGEYKEHPTLGVGLTDMANDDELTAWKKLIREELSKDSMRVEKLSINASGMEIKAIY